MVDPSSSIAGIAAKKAGSKASKVLQRSDIRMAAPSLITISVQHPGFSVTSPKRRIWVSNLNNYPCTINLRLAQGEKECDIESLGPIDPHSSIAEEIQLPPEFDPEAVATYTLESGWLWVEGEKMAFDGESKTRLARIKDRVIPDRDYGTLFTASLNKQTFGPRQFGGLLMTNKSPDALTNLRVILEVAGEKHFDTDDQIHQTDLAVPSVVGVAPYSTIKLSFIQASEVEANLFENGGVRCILEGDVMRGNDLVPFRNSVEISSHPGIEPDDLMEFH